MALRDEIKRENIKIKDMSFKKKIEYIWEYYKVHIISITAAIIFICVFVQEYKENKRPLYLDVILINSDIAYEDTNYIKDDFIKYSDIDIETYNLTIDPTPVISETQNDQMTIANIQKVMAMYAAGDLDVVIGPDSIINGYGAVGAHMDLTSVLDNDLKKTLTDKGYEIYYTTVYEEDENGNQQAIETYPAGVYLDNSEYLNNLSTIGAYKTQKDAGKRPVFTITSGSSRTEHALELLKMITGI